uniref:HAT C-terminal dimerisation domain-containing protein n=1 Tax=Monopterus albus TaxID=43700 RepID=A0A3Q3JQM6_MONAL
SHFAGSLAIVRNGKPFTDDEYAKTFMLDVANELFDDFLDKDKIIKRIKDMPLSANTVHDRTIMMDNQVEETQVKDINSCCFANEREALCVMSLVIRVVNFIVARALNDRQFKTLLDEVGNNYPGLLLHSNVCWLSRGKVLSCFAACLIACTASDPAQHFDLQQLAGFTSNLLQSFKARFGEFCEHTRLFKFITHPHECALDKADLSYIPGVSIRDFEVEVADLKASDMWVNKFKSLNEDLERLARQQAELVSKHQWTEMKKLQPTDQLIVKTWNVLPVTYHTLQLVSIQSFSYLKNIKTNLRSRLMDGSLNACMKLNLTTYQPDYKAISKTMQHQKSH